MARQIEGGASELVEVTTDESLVETDESLVETRYVTPVYGFPNAERGIVQGSGPSLVYVVSDAQIASGKYKLMGGAAESVTDIATGRVGSGGGAVPVYLVGGSLAGAGGAAVPVLLIYDQFTDTNGVLLENHTPNTAPVGSVWQKKWTGVYDIQSNKASWVSGAGLYVIDSGVADGEISVIANMTSVSSFPAIAFRTTDLNNWFLARLKTNAVDILKRKAGAITTPENAAFVATVGTPYVLSVVLDGSSMKFFVDGVEVLSHTDADFSAVTTHGIYAENALTFDEFQVIG